MLGLVRRAPRWSLKPPTPATTSIFRLLFHTGTRRSHAAVVSGSREPQPIQQPVTPETAPHGTALATALDAKSPRSNWTKDEITEIYHTPLMELIHTSVRSFMRAKSFPLSLGPLIVFDIDGKLHEYPKQYK